MDSDLELAIKLHNEWNSASLTAKEEMKGRKHNAKGGIVDSEWEITDPNPDIHTLFQVFDKKYFWGKLDCVEVKWSPRMYSCAGTCTYKGKLGGCVISLSLPLLKLRPRKDLVETLLHEMIHAYLFVADKNRDRGEHGPKFHEHMHRINKEAGTKITVYHTFHDEVKHYKQHWWRCNGPCQTQKPFFGLVKRSMNRAPGPNDFWFPHHKAKCGGEFTKIKEPENFKSRKRQGDKSSGTSDKKKKGTPLAPVNTLFPKVPTNTSTSSIRTIKNSNTSAKIENYNKISNVHGFTNLSKPAASNISNSSSKKGGYFGGVGLKSNMGGTLLVNPKTSTSTTNLNKTEDENKKTCQGSEIVPFSGQGYVLGGSTPDRSKSRLLNLFQNSPRNTKSESPSVSNGSNSNIPSTSRSDAVSTSETIFIDESSETDEDGYERNVHCPVCNNEVPQGLINDHLECCMQLESVFERTLSVSDEEVESEDNRNPPGDDEPSDVVHCPACGTRSSHKDINEHLDNCLK